MGNARVIFVGAVSVVLGLYSVGLQRSERAVARVAEVHSYQMQAEEIANASISLAINQMGTTKPSTLPSLTGRSMFGGVGSYVVDDAGLGANEARITATGVFQSHTVVRVAVIRKISAVASQRKKWANWEIVKVRTILDSSEFTNQFVTE